MAISTNCNQLKAAEAGEFAEPYSAHTQSSHTRLRLKTTAQPSQPGKLLSVTMAPLEIGRLQASAYGDELQLKTK